MASYTLHVNGKAERVESWDPDQPLLYLLRNALGLHGPKFGCGLGQCGACTVLMDGEAVRSCSLPVSAAQGKSVTTLEGLGSPEKPDRLQAAFIAEQAAQCGYCTNGMIMTAKGLLDSKKNPSRAEIVEAMAPVLCRCGTHARIIRAIHAAAKRSPT
jgi:nicotinate dehydrogenase subunit A